MTGISDAGADPVRLRFRDASSSWDIHLAPQFVFSHPDDVLTAPYLGDREIHAILTSWASDRFAVAHSPSLRSCPGLKGKFVPLRWVERALAALERQRRSSHVRIGPREGDLPLRIPSRTRRAVRTIARRSASRSGDQPMR